MIAHLSCLRTGTFRSVFYFDGLGAAVVCALSLHDALPISDDGEAEPGAAQVARARLVDTVEALGDPRQVGARDADARVAHAHRSEEHTSELQSHSDLVCRLLLEKKNRRQHVA